MAIGFVGNFKFILIFTYLPNYLEYKKTPCKVSKTTQLNINIILLERF